MAAPRCSLGSCKAEKSSTSSRRVPRCYASCTRSRHSVRFSLRGLPFSGSSPVATWLEGKTPLDNYCGRREEKKKCVADLVSMLNKEKSRQTVRGNHHNRYTKSRIPPIDWYAERQSKRFNSPNFPDLISFLDMGTTWNLILRNPNSASQRRNHGAGSRALCRRTSPALLFEWRLAATLESKLSDRLPTVLSFQQRHTAEGELGVVGLVS